MPGSPRRPNGYRSKVADEEAQMSVGTTMKMVGKGAKYRAENMAHDMKDRAVERRLDRAHAEGERLRNENDLLRDEVTETRAEHRRILDLLEERFAELSEDVDEVDGKKSHKFRWFLFLLAAGGAAYYWFTQRGGETDEWGVQTSGGPTVTESSTTTAL
jgi:hypothetical protein